MTIGISKATASLQDRYLLTQVGGQSLVFPAHWVTDILVIERAQVLALPFYNPRILGVIHYQGKIVPLVSAHSFFYEGQDRQGLTKPTQLPPPAGGRTLTKETLIAVRLSNSLKALVGVGIIVDRLVNSVTADKLAEERVFQLNDLPDSLWQPQRWYLKE